MLHHEIVEFLRVLWVLGWGYWYMRTWEDTQLVPTWYNVLGAALLTALWPLLWPGVQLWDRLHR